MSSQIWPYGRLIIAPYISHLHTSIMYSAGRAGRQSEMVKEKTKIGRRRGRGRSEVMGI
jgi:hypothetical protein